MVSFDAKQIADGALKLYELRPHIEQVAAKLHSQKVQSLLITSAGGSTAMMQPFAVLLKSRSALPVVVETAAELVLTGSPALNPGTAALLASKSGDTPETLQVAQYLKERKIPIVAFVGTAGSPLAKMADYPIVYGEGRPQELALYLLLGKLLHLRGEFAAYSKFADELAGLGNMLVSVAQQADEMALAYAQKHKDSPYQLWIGSGELEGPTYSFAMCTREECQWMRTKFVTSPEFFHGTIELVEKGVPVALAMGEGATRPLDERVQKFVEQYSDDVTLFDTMGYRLPGLSDEFRPWLCPVVLNTVLARVAKNFEHLRGHSLDKRRYYRVLEY